MNRYHVHANIHRMSDTTPTRFEAIGMSSDPFVPLATSYAPPFHHSIETSNASVARRCWAAAIEIMHADEAFCGYVERETIAERFEDTYDGSRPYVPVGAFPLANMSLVPVPQGGHKRADLHVKRVLTDVQDELDRQLLQVGFYEVLTPRHRIYTLQCESAADARQLFFRLRDHLEPAGGAKMVNFEVVTRLVRNPPDFEMAHYLPAGQAQFADAN